MINLNHAVKFQHLFWQDQLKEAHVIVDATAGNGHDLLYMATHCAPGASLWGFDIQNDALQNSKDLLNKECHRADITISLVQGSHDDLLEQTPWPQQGIDLLIFNLGYLPGGNHDCMTRSDTTVKALETGLSKLSAHGLITVVAYPGTAEGQAEMEAVEAYLQTIPQKQYDVSTWQPLNQANHPPILFLIKGR